MYDEVSINSVVAQTFSVGYFLVRGMFWMNDHVRIFLFLLGGFIYYTAEEQRQPRIFVRFSGISRTLVELY